MGIPQLPKIDIPEEETLIDEDKHIWDAVKIIQNGYQRSQSRYRALSKAYRQLESIALNLLNEHNENDEMTKPSPKKRELPSPAKNVRKRLSPLQLHSNRSRDDELDVLMVDLTCDFDTSARPHNVATSPVFGHQKKKGRKTGGLEKTESTKNLKQQFKELDGGSSTAKVENRPSTTNQEWNTLDVEAAENDEENEPPLTSCNDTTLYLNESQAVAKIGFSKAVYNIEAHRTSTGKRSKQSTLVLKPQTPKMDLSASDAFTFARPNVCQKLGDLFDENYSNTKKPAAKIGREKEQERRQINVKDLVDEKSEQAVSPKTNAAVSKAIVGVDKDQKSEETLIKRKEVPLTIETPSQIDETARSLFDDDDDLDVFNGSEDLLNTCMDSPITADNTIQQLIPAVKKENRVEEIASTSKTSQSLHALDSIDETFFAPVEVNMPERVIGNVEKSNTKPGCSTTAEARDSWDTNRNLKRKSGDETAVEAAKELGDFGVQDIDWDQDISNDNWLTAKRTLNSSFDIIPEKKKKNPNYAYKGKVERNHTERAKLRGWDCKDCENYYGNQNLPEEERKKLMDRCSRHRSKFNPRYLTPQGFWDPVFPDSSDNSDEN